MEDQFSRTRSLVGDSALKKLNAAHVAIFGLGGVGGYAAEALARAGVGKLDLVDKDVVAPSNINRQIYAMHSTVGRYKTEVARERILDIYPSCDVTIHTMFFTESNAANFDFAKYDYVVDAIDTVACKLVLIRCATAAGTPVISAMGAGNKLDATSFEVADIYDTSVCPLAKVMRRELRKLGIERLKVVYSKEEPLRPASQAPETNSLEWAQRDDEQICDKTQGSDTNNIIKNASDETRRATPGSVSFVPPVMGMIMAGEVIKDIIRKQ